MKPLEERIKTGLSFFEKVIGSNYNADQLKLYLPTYIRLFRAYVNVREAVEETEKLVDVKAAEKIFGTKAV